MIDVTSTKRRYYYYVEDVQALVRTLIEYHSKPERYNPAAYGYRGYGYGWPGREAGDAARKGSQEVARRVRDALGRNGIEAIEFVNRDGTVIEVGYSKSGENYYVKLREPEPENVGVPVA